MTPIKIIGVSGMEKFSVMKFSLTHKRTRENLEASHGTMSLCSHLQVSSSLLYKYNQMLVS